MKRMFNNRKESGITLVALVVTIIVLLILAAITINTVLGQNGLFDRATGARGVSERASAIDQAKMDIMEWQADKLSKGEDAELDDDIVRGILSNSRPYVKTAGESSFISTKGEHEIPYSELYTVSDTPSAATLPAGTYTAGQEVTFGGEQFFVIADDGTSVKLLAKYCLTQDGTEQTDKYATYDGSNSTVSYGRRFSQTNYWADNIISNAYDLQSDEMIEEARGDGTIIQNAVLTAMKYGEYKGAEGRLMTTIEANSIDPNIRDGKWTDGTQPTQNNLLFWLGEAFSATVVRNGSLAGYDYYTYESNYYGVRPVLIVQKAH